MLVDQDNSNILALLGEVLKRLLDLRSLSLAVNDKEVSLGVWAIGHMLWTQFRISISHTIERRGPLGGSLRDCTYSDASEQKTGNGAKEEVAVSWK